MTFLCCLPVFNIGKLIPQPVMHRPFTTLTGDWKIICFCLESIYFVHSDVFIIHVFWKHPYSKINYLTEWNQVIMNSERSFWLDLAYWLFLPRNIKSWVKFIYLPSLNIIFQSSYLLNRCLNKKLVQFYFRFQWNIAPTDFKITALDEFQSTARFDWIIVSSKLALIS